LRTCVEVAVPTVRSKNCQNSSHFTAESRRLVCYTLASMGETVFMGTKTQASLMFVAACHLLWTMMAPYTRSWVSAPLTIFFSVYQQAGKQLRWCWEAARQSWH